MKWGFKMSKEKEEQTPEAVAEEVTEEAESIEEEAKESSEAEPMEDTSEESSETEPTEDTSEQNSETESSENESEENSETEKKQGFSAVWWLDLQRPETALCQELIPFSVAFLP